MEKYDLENADLRNGYIMCSNGVYYGTGTYQEADKICSGLGLKIWTPKKNLSDLYRIAVNISQSRKRR